MVGFLGDGINDSPALKAADVGISVDTAVDIAKESADIILLEKSLMVLQDGVVEGRRVFGNINKYIKMGASSNFGNMFSVLGASIFLPFLPMTAIQVLTNNLLYDFSQTTIPTDNVDEDYLTIPRKWDIDNIFKFMIFIGPISSIFDYATFFVMLYVFNSWENPSLFQTGWFIRIAFDANVDHSHHPHCENSFHTKPGEHAPYRDDDYRLLRRHRSALYVGRRKPRFYNAAPCLLVYFSWHASNLRYPHPFCENLVYP